MYIPAVLTIRSSAFHICGICVSLRLNSTYILKQRQPFDLVLPGCVMVIVLAIRPKVRGSNPAESKELFKGNKNPYHDFL
jgi:hypothetical protein